MIKKDNFLKSLIRSLIVIACLGYFFMAFDILSQTHLPGVFLEFLPWLAGILVIKGLDSLIEKKPKKAEPIVKRMNAKTYVEFKDSLFKQASRMGYQEACSAPLFDDMDNTLTFKRNEKNVYILQTVWMSDFDESYLNQATESAWTELSKFVGDDDLDAMAIGFMQCVCVQRMNGAFQKLRRSISPQDKNRYQVLVGISFGGKCAYIRKCKSWRYRGNYKSLLGEFESVAAAVIGDIEKYIS